MYPRGWDSLPFCLPCAGYSKKWWWPLVGLRRRAASAQPRKAAGASGSNSASRPQTCSNWGRTAGGHPLQAHRSRASPGGLGYSEFEPLGCQGARLRPCGRWRWLQYGSSQEAVEALVAACGLDGSSSTMEPGFAAPSSHGTPAGHAGSPGSAAGSYTPAFARAQPRGSRRRSLCRAPPVLNARQPPSRPH